MAAISAMFLTGAETYSKVDQLRREQGAIRSRGRFAEEQFLRNAGIADLQAADATRRGEQTAFLRGAAGRQTVGSQRAALGAQGLDLAVGSAADVQTNESFLSALDQATIRNNAAREAWGYRVQGDDLRRRGAMARAGADAEALGLDSEIGSTLITGAGKTYGLWRQRRDGGGARSTASRGTRARTSTTYPDD